MKYSEKPLEKAC